MFPEIDQAIASINENQAALNDPNIPGQGTRQVLFNVENALSNLLDNADRLVTAASLGTDKTGLDLLPISPVFSWIFLFLGADLKGEYDSPQGLVFGSNVLKRYLCWRSCQ